MCNSQGNVTLRVIELSRYVHEPGDEAAVLHMIRWCEENNQPMLYDIYKNLLEVVRERGAK